MSRSLQQLLALAVVCVFATASGPALAKGKKKRDRPTWITARVGTGMYSSQYADYEDLPEDADYAVRSSAAGFGWSGHLELLVPENFGRPKDFKWFHYGLGVSHDRFSGDTMARLTPDGAAPSNEYAYLRSHRSKVGVVLAAAGPKTVGSFELGPAFGGLETTRAGSLEDARSGSGPTATARIVHSHFRLALARRYQVPGPVKPVLSVSCSGTIIGGLPSNRRVAPYSSDDTRLDYVTTGIELGAAFGVR